MSFDEQLERATDRVATGEAVDWPALEQAATSDEDRRRIEDLRLIELLADIATTAANAMAPPAGSVSGGNRAPLVPAPEPEGDPALGWFGGYKLLEEVGSGTYGRVYRAWDPKLATQRAIKVLFDAVTDEHVRERLVREGRALAQVQDVNIVKVHGIETDGDRVGLVMEFVDGETLYDVVQGRRLSEGEAILVGQDVCRALCTVHTAGYVHRDVKAQNIMRRRSGGSIVLMDFGTGRQVEELAQARGRGSVAGTPLYMAPEALLGESADQRNDIYSLGVLLYYLATRDYPVEGDTVDALRRAHTLGRRVPISDRRSDLSPRFIQLVDRCLHPTPEQRYGSAGELLQDLIVRDERVWLRRLRTALLWTAAILLVVTLMGAANSWYFNVALGRADFVDEGPLDWFLWGARSLIAPTVLAAMFLAGFVFLLVGGYFCRKVLPGVGALENRCRDTVRRWKLDDVTNLSACAFLLSFVVLLGALIRYSQMIDGLLNFAPNISTAAHEQLSRVSPYYRPHFENFRKTFICVTLFCSAVWVLPVILAIRRRQRLNRGLLAGAIAIVLVSVLTLDFPYRIIYHARMEVALWQGARCYILAQRADDALLFCPPFDPPRIRTTSFEDGDLRPQGITEHIFTQFSPKEMGRR